MEKSSRPVIFPDTKNLLQSRKRKSCNTEPEMAQEVSLRHDYSFYPVSRLVGNIYGQNSITIPLH